MAYESFITMSPTFTTLTMRIASEKNLPAATSPFDPTRFAHLSETEILRRIGELLATALVRSGRLARSRNTSSFRSSTPVAARADWVDLIGDPIERQLARYLQCVGPTAPRELIAAFGLSRRTAARKLTRLRAKGICEVIGNTRGARYQLRAEHGRN